MSPQIDRETLRQHIRRARRSYGLYRALDAWAATARQLRRSDDLHAVRDLLGELSHAMLEAQREVADLLDAAPGAPPSPAHSEAREARDAYLNDLTRGLDLLAAEIQTCRQRLDGTSTGTATETGSRADDAAVTPPTDPVDAQRAAAVALRRALLRAGHEPPFTPAVHRRWARALEHFRLRHQPPTPRSDGCECFVLALSCDDDRRWEEVKEIVEAHGGVMFERPGSGIRVEVSTGYGVDDEAFRRARCIESGLAKLSLIYIDPPDADDGYTLVPTTYPECFEPD